jgi:hypothetical protein
MNMKNEKIFYYKFEPINAWFVFNTALLIVLLYGSFRCPFLLSWWQTQVLWDGAVFSVLAWGYKYLLKHRAAVIDDEAVTIDHCRPLPWADIRAAEEKTVKCGLRKYRVIVLEPKEGIDYRYNFLQKHNCRFSPFSIPLYGILSDEDIAEIKRLISEKVGPVRTAEE